MGVGRRSLPGRDEPAVQQWRGPAVPVTPRGGRIDEANPPRSPPAIRDEDAMLPASASQTAAAKPKRRWLRYSLRTLLVMMLLVGIGMG